MLTRRINTPCRIRFRKSVSSLLLIGLLTCLVGFSNCDQVGANDKIKQAIQNYEARVEEERAKVIAIFERESKLAERKRDKRHELWLASARSSWMNNELMVSERGGLRFFTGTEESFGVDDFALTGDFEAKENILRANAGNASVRMSKPAKSLYFRGLVESKNNFVVHFNQSHLSAEKDLAIIVGGWNNARSEIHFDGETIASKPVGMPPRWLCEVYCQNQGVTIYANGVVLMEAKLPRPLAVGQATLSVSHDSKTAIYQPSLKVK